MFTFVFQNYKQNSNGRFSVLLVNEFLELAERKK